MYESNDRYVVSVYSLSGILLREYNSAIIEDYDNTRCILKIPLTNNTDIVKDATQEIIINNATIIAEQIC